MYVDWDSVARSVNSNTLGKVYGGVDEVSMIEEVWRMEVATVYPLFQRFGQHLAVESMYP